MLFLLVIFTIIVVYFICVNIIKLYVRLSSVPCLCKTNLEGKTAIVTGGASGIGYQIVLTLASRGCRVIIADKITDDSIRLDAIKKTNNNKIIMKHVDFVSLQSVKVFAQDIMNTEEKLDILINNIGVLAIKTNFTEDGLHNLMQINHFSSFLLTYLLLDLLIKSSPSRIIFVSSSAVYFGNLSVNNINPKIGSENTFWKKFVTYGNSKLCNLIVSNKFAEILKGTGVTCNAVDPGSGYTGIFSPVVDIHPYIYYAFYNYALYYGAKTPEQGAQSAVHVAICPKFQYETGKFIYECYDRAMPEQIRYDKKLCEEIWNISKDLVGLKSRANFQLINGKDLQECQ